MAGGVALYAELEDHDLTRESELAQSDLARDPQIPIGQDQRKAASRKSESL
jgi:hypothetical protein